MIIKSPTSCTGQDRTGECLWFLNMMSSFRSVSIQKVYIRLLFTRNAKSMSSWGTPELNKSKTEHSENKRQLRSYTPIYGASVTVSPARLNGKGSPPTHTHTRESERERVRESCVYMCMREREKGTPVGNGGKGGSKPKVCFWFITLSW